MQVPFAEIYEKNIWGFGSGHGSLPSVTKAYRDLVERFIRENHIRTVVDFGCGDWQFSRLMDWQGSDYLGLDIVPSIIEANRERYARKGVRFELYDGKAPEADLLLVKDVLQHWPTKDVADFIADTLPRFRYALITNCIHPLDHLNADISMGEFRPLDLQRPPFNLRGESALTFDGPKTFSWKRLQFFGAWRKQTLLYTK